MERDIEKIKKQVKGITIITLVVTIIVLLILSGIVISYSLGNDGILKKAKEGVEIYQNTSQNEKIELDKVANSIGDYINSDKEKEEIKSTLGTVTGDEKTNTKVNDCYGNKVVVPAGFKIVNPEDNVPDGIIIEDVKAGDEISKGNQYVWVPLGRVYKNAKGEYETINLGRYDINWEKHTLEIKQLSENYSEIITIGEIYQELLNSNYGNSVARNLEKYIINSIKNKGYYIGRYEVGDNDANEARNFDDYTSNPDSIPVVKESKWPYNYVNQLDASRLSKNMYSTNNNFESDLINSYAWDTAIQFIQTFSDNKLYSEQHAVQGNIKQTGSIDIASNSYDVKCNIYDMANNTSEWSTETGIKDEFPCTARGGVFNQENYVSFGRYYGGTISSHATYSFRTILYINE